jgi:hypothetical protein
MLQSTHIAGVICSTAVPLQPARGSKGRSCAVALPLPTPAADPRTDHIEQLDCTLCWPQAKLLQLPCSLCFAPICCSCCCHAGWRQIQEHGPAANLKPPRPPCPRYRTYETHPWIVRDLRTGLRMMLGDRLVGPPPQHLECNCTPQAWGRWKGGLLDAKNVSP